ncbi:MAG: hypothetical protein FWF71_07965 [Actinomycetia bacterium]|nr:hypothetical protein [Actinomycetes bacterium]
MICTMLPLGGGANRTRKASAIFMVNSALPQGYRQLSNELAEAPLFHQFDDGSYPPTVGNYLAFYQRFQPSAEDGYRFLAGLEGIISAELPTRPTGAAADQESTALPSAASGRELLGRVGQVVGIVVGPEAESLNILASQGWVLHCMLSLVNFESETKHFSGEVAWFAYNGQLHEEHKQSLERFIANIAKRIGGGDHPRIALNQEDFAHVLSSGGAWHLTKAEPPVGLPPNSINYRKRRGLSERLVELAYAQKAGCSIAAWVGTAIIVALIVWLIISILN